MAQIAKMDVQVEIKASADKFYEIFLSKGYLLPKMCPNVIKDLQVIQGDWGSVGSVKQWTYFAAGNNKNYWKNIYACQLKIFYIYTRLDRLYNLTWTQ